MYENAYKNIRNTNLKDLESFLQLIADMDIKIELFAIGGTAMILKNIKESTKDIDFLTTSKYEDIKKAFELAGLKEESSSKLCNIWYLDKNVRIDIFYDEFIMGLPLEKGWRDLSEHIRNIGKIELYILDWYYIIISKIARSEARDIEDIKAIIRTQRIDFGKLKKKYYKEAETALIAEYDIKFKHAEKRVLQK